MSSLTGFPERSTVSSWMFFSMFSIAEMRLWLMCNDCRFSSSSSPEIRSILHAWTSKRFKLSLKQVRRWQAFHLGHFLSWKQSVSDWSRSTNGLIFLHVCWVIFVRLIGEFGVMIRTKSRTNYSMSHTKMTHTWNRVICWSRPIISELLPFTTYIKNIKTLQYIFFIDSNKL